MLLMKVVWELNFFLSRPRQRHNKSCEEMFPLKMKTMITAGVSFLTSIFFIQTNSGCVGGQSHL